MQELDADHPIYGACSIMLQAEVRYTLAIKVNRYHLVAPLP